MGSVAQWPDGLPPGASTHAATACAFPVLALLVLLLTICPRVAAGPAEEPFYRQLIDTRAPAGYQPTRAFTIVVDASRDNRLVAEDDPSLQFNLIWLDQHQQGYRHREGGAGLGLLVRSYLQQVLDAWRGENSGSLTYVPDGEIEAARLGSLDGDMEYHLRVSDDEVKLRFEYVY